MGFMDKLLSAAETKFGKQGCYVAPEHEKRIVGLPLPYLALQTLFGADIFQLHTIKEFAGPPGSGKSALAFFLLGVFIEQNANAVLIETENKLSPSLLRSILGDDKFDNLIIWEGCTQLEVWQDKMTFTIDEYRKVYNASVKARNEALAKRKKCKKQESKDAIVIPPVEPPLLIALDSLGGPLSIDSAKAIAADGHASKSFPVEALKNSRYFSNLPEKIRDIPVTILYTNHKMLNLGADSSFGDNERSKGGATPAFFCSHRVFFDEMSALRNPRQGHFEQNMRFKCVKNSLNQKSKPMRLLMEWDKWVENGDEKQVTRFGWPEALVQRLAPDKAGFDYDRETVKKFLTVTFKSLVKYNCKELKMVDASPREVGERIENNVRINKKLAPYLGIKSWPKFNVDDPDRELHNILPPAEADVVTTVMKEVKTNVVATVLKEIEEKDEKSN